MLSQEKQELQEKQEKQVLLELQELQESQVLLELQKLQVSQVSWRRHARERDGAERSAVNRYAASVLRQPAKNFTSR